MAAVTDSPPDAVADGGRAVATWLAVSAAMVAAMVVLGGATRLTESGLSMVSWRPLTGALPPIGDAEWQAVFQQYKTSPQFRSVNFWMDVDDFRTIFWLEYIHRLWGRLIGAVFLVPFLWFAARRRLSRALLLRSAVVFALGAAQGLLGWYMVKSGLVDRPEVSQYRLAAHLMLAFAIYGALLWLILGLVRCGQADPAAARLRTLALVLLGWTTVAVCAGAFVAGLDAGTAYNTFPLMDGRLLPEGAFAQEPWPVNFFDNPALVQFTHRILGIGLVVLAAWLWLRAVRAGVTGAARTALHWVAAMALVQAGLGISTLLSQVALPVALAHQAGALVLFSLVIWAVYELGTVRRPPTTVPAR